METRGHAALAHAQGAVTPPDVAAVGGGRRHQHSAQPLLTGYQTPVQPSPVTRSARTLKSPSPVPRSSCSSVTSLRRCIAREVEAKIWELCKESWNEMEPRILWNIAQAKENIVKIIVETNGETLSREPHSGVRLRFGTGKALRPMKEPAARITITTTTTTTTTTAQMTIPTTTGHDEFEEEGDDIGPFGYRDVNDADDPEDLHRCKHKKANCNSCGRCPRCAPPDLCKTPENHSGST